MPSTARQETTCGRQGVGAACTAPREWRWAGARCSPPRSATEDEVSSLRPTTPRPARRSGPRISLRAASARSTCSRSPTAGWCLPPPADFLLGRGGTIYALDQATGEVVWSFATVEDEGLWGNPDVNSGGGAWYPPALDTDSGTLFLRRGQPLSLPRRPRLARGIEPPRRQPLDQRHRGAGHRHRRASLGIPSLPPRHLRPRPCAGGPGQGRGPRPRPRRAGVGGQGRGGVRP